MRKLRKAAVVMAVLGSVGLVGAGTAYASCGTDRGDSHPQPSHQNVSRQQSSGRHQHGRPHRRKVVILQHTSCRAYDKNVDVLGQVGVLDGLLGHRHGWKDRRDEQATRIGSSVGCNNVVRL
ncbi:hypothetical protein ACO0M4_06265 [Streptomyces sp. RGM 3693]|uniref:hypothetical protein n=1 Tax=Streptomyces sp. RGM 3693 TaxID=3413284 RepID=UPI003D270C8D